MDQSNLISIIMPVKNTEKYLTDCLNSILHQTHEHWELIAVDDHSTDGSLSILREYASKDSRITVHPSKAENITAALETGYEVITGEFVTRMDSDDMMHPSKLVVLLEALIKNPEYQIAAGSVRYFTDEGQVGDGFLKYARWLNAIASENSYWDHVYRECVIPSACWIMRRQDFDSIGGFHSDLYPEDYDLCFRIFQAGYKVVGIEDQIHHWRDRSDRASRTMKQYSDNRFFEIKIQYFKSTTYNSERSLIIWGAGKNGKDLAKVLQEHRLRFEWVCDNENKVGKHIYGVELNKPKILIDSKDPQVLIAVANPKERIEIETYLNSLGLTPSQDYWFFL